jgi:DNA-binding beta-propeller fold protein YncE
MPTDLTQIEDTLRAAYSDVAATVRPDDISDQAPAPTSPLRSHAAARTRSRRGPALAAAAAVLVIVITATVIPNVLQSGSRHRSGGPVAHTHIAYATTQRDQLIPVNLATGATLTPITLGVKGYDVGLAISPDGKMVYVLTARGQLVPVDVRTGKVGQPITFGGISQELVTTPDGKSAYVLQPPYGVVALDLATRTGLGFIKIHDADSFALTPNGKTLYVLGLTASTKSPVLTAIDTATNTTIATIELHASGTAMVPISPWSLAMAPDGETVYAVFDYERGTVARPRSTDEIIPVDVTSNTVRTPIVSGTVSGVLWRGLTISPNSQTGYLQQTQSLSPVDLRAGIVRATMPLRFPFGVNNDLTFSPDGQRLYLIQSIGAKVIPIDTATDAAMRPIQLGTPRSYVASDGVFAPGSEKMLYVLSGGTFPKFMPGYGPGLMTPVDVATGAVGKSIDFPDGLDDIVFSP